MCIILSVLLGTYILVYTSLVLPTIFHALFGLYCDLQSLDLHLCAALDQIGPGNRHRDLVNEAIHDL